MSQRLFHFVFDQHLVFLEAVKKGTQSAVGFVLKGAINQRLTTLPFTAQMFNCLGILVDFYWFEAKRAVVSCTQMYWGCFTPTEHHRSPGSCLQVLNFMLLNLIERVLSETLSSWKMRYSWSCRRDLRNLVMSNLMRAQKNLQCI